MHSKFPKILDDCLFNLEVIGNIAKGQKINTTDEVVDIETDSIFQGILRTFNRDSRKKTMTALHRIIYTVIEYSGIIMESRHLEKLAPVDKDLANRSQDEINVHVYHGPNQKPNDLTYQQNVVGYMRARTMPPEYVDRVNWLKRINIVMTAARNGLKNLYDTYQDDSNMLAKLKPIIEDVDICINDVRTFLHEIGELESLW